MGSSFLSTTISVRRSPRRTCFISLPQCLVSSVVPSSVHVFSITNKSGHECLLSWAGESHVTESSSVPAIILSDKVLSMNGFCVEECESVILKQIPTPLPSERVCVSVSTVSDWENLILNRDVVQLEFLEQLRLVFPGLKFPLWLEGGTCVEMTVLRITPAAVCGLLLPLTYVEVIPPDQGAIPTQENIMSRSLNFDSTDNSTEPSGSANFVYDASASDEKIVRVSNIESTLTSLAKSVLSNLCLVNQSIVDTPSPRTVKSLRVLPAPPYPLLNTQRHPLSSIVIVSRDAVVGTQFREHSFFPARIQLSYPTPLAEDVKNTLNKKSVVKVESRELCVMIMVLENARRSTSDVYNLDSICPRDVMGHNAVIPDTLRRVLGLPVPCLVRLETGNLRLRSDPLLIDVQPLQSLQESECEVVSANLKLFLKNSCGLCDTIVNDRSIYSVMLHKRPIEVLVLLRGGDPLLLTRTTVDILKVRVTAHPSHKELLRVPRLPPALDSNSNFFSASHSFVGNVTLIGSMKKSAMRQLGITPCRLSEPKFSLLVGEAASGRTTLTQTLCRDLSSLSCRVHCRIVTLKEYIGKKAEAVEKRLLDAAHRASLLRPSLLVLDDLDVLCPARSSDDTLGPVSDHHFQLVCAVQNMLRFVARSNAALKFQDDHQFGNVLVLGVSVHRSTLDQRLASLDRSDLFPVTVALPPLTHASRVQALKKILLERLSLLEKPCSSLEADCTDDHFLHLDKTKLMKITEGYKLPDLANLAMRISMAVVEKLRSRSHDSCGPQHWSRCKLHSVESLGNGTVSVRCGRPQPPLLRDLVSDEDVAAAAAQYVPLAYKDVAHKGKSESASLSLGGLHSARRLLEECLCWPSVYPQLFRQCPAAAVTGLLLYGPPGCGKTRLAHHIAVKANVNFITVKGPELLSKYIGQSEENVRETFSRAAGRAPCLLFFDEFDALAPRRGHDSTGVTDRVVNQLLTELDGAEGRDGVWVMAATCRPDLIDPALLRPGRLEKCIYCPLPTEEERAEILSTLSASLVLSTAVDWHHIAALTPGLSGADLQSVLTTAHIAAVRELMNDVLDRGVVTRDGGKGGTVADGKLQSEDTTRVEPSSVARYKTHEELEDGGRSRDVESCIKENAQSERASKDLLKNESSFGSNSSGDVSSSEEIIGGAQQVVLWKNNLKTPINEHSDTPQINDKLEVQASKENGGARQEQVLISLSHLLSAVHEVKPSVSASERLKYEALHESFSRSSKSRFTNPSPGQRATLA